MLVPPRPENESARLAALYALQLIHSAAEERFDRLTRLARRLFDVPIASVNLVAEDSLYAKACCGLESRKPIPRDISFCAHAILGDDILVVPDARADLRFHDSPLVTGEPRVRFYAGSPLAVPDGCKLGTLCLLDTVPRTLNHEDLKLLRDLATIVEQELAALQLATMDGLTELSNRRGFELLGQQALHVCKRLGKPASLLFFDLNRFKQINDTYGHAEGDRALSVFAEVLGSAFRTSDLIGRLGGDEFVALLINSSVRETSAAVERLRDAIDVRNAEDRRGYDICFSVGQVDLNASRHNSIAELLAEGGLAMYRDKQAMRSHSAPH